MGHLSDQLHLEEEFFDSTALISVLAIILTLKIWAHYQKEKIQFYFKKSETLISEFLMKSKIRRMEYVPWIVTLNGHL